MTRKDSDRYWNDIIARGLNLFILVMASHRLIKRAFAAGKEVSRASRLKGRAAGVVLLLTHCLMVTMFPLSQLGRHILKTWRCQPRYLKELVLLRGTEVNLVCGNEVYAGNGRWFSR